MLHEGVSCSLVDENKVWYRETIQLSQIMVVYVLYFHGVSALGDANNFV